MVSDLMAFSAETSIEVFRAIPSNPDLEKVVVENVVVKKNGKSSFAEFFISGYGEHGNLVCARGRSTP